MKGVHTVKNEPFMLLCYKFLFWCIDPSSCFKNLHCFSKTLLGQNLQQQKCLFSNLFIFRPQVSKDIVIIKIPVNKASLLRRIISLDVPCDGWSFLAYGCYNALIISTKELTLTKCQRKITCFGSHATFQWM